MRRLQRLIESYLPVWLVILSLVALFWNQVPGPDPFVLSAKYLPLVIVVTMFAVGWMLPTDEIRQVGQRWPLVLFGTAVQYLSMPTLAYLLARLWRLPEDYVIGVIMVGCVPGAMASNVLTLAAGGNTSYSVSLTTLATMLSPLMVPLAMHLTLGRSVSFDPSKTAWDLSWMVVFPVVTGHSLSRLVPVWREGAAVLGSLVANLAVLWIIAVVVGMNRDRLVQFDGQLLTALLLLNMLGYVAGYASASSLGMSEPMRRALTIEIGMQNAGLGTTLVTQMFADRPAATLPTAIYTFGCMLTGAILARGWRWRDRTISPVRNMS
jgi:BASS family bile acid:Na+ symporter